MNNNNDINDIIDKVVHELTEAKIEAPAAEAAIIVSHVLEVSRGELGVHKIMRKSVNQEHVTLIEEFTAQRATRIPLQHVLGEAHFYGLSLRTDPAVFIPRPETEILVEYTLQQLDGTTGPLKILDLCTGSGAIAVALAENLKQRPTPVEIWAIENNPAAVELAQHNTGTYHITVVQADATQHYAVVEAAPELVENVGAFDVVVSNPPYIPTTTPVTQTEALQDPETALYGGSADGTQIPLAVAQQAAHWLKPGGLFVMEHDHTHAQQLHNTLRDNNQWDRVKTLNDLTKTPRFLTARRTSSAQTPQTNS